MIRAALIGVVALFLSASAASAQGQPQKQGVISKAVMKSMVAHKSKSKTPLGTKAGIVPRKTFVAAKSANAGPTSVSEIKSMSGKK